jgi:hypothetical protein
LPVGNALAQGATSLWDSDFGTLELTVTPEGRVTGVYPDYSGTFRGALNPDTRTISGFWMQPKSEVKCDKARSGTVYWGRVTWEISSAEELFGKWSYCDQPEGASGVWEAWLEGGSPILADAGSAPAPAASSAGGGVEEGMMWEAARYSWGTSMIPTNVTMIKGDVTCDGVEDGVITYLDLDNPDGPFLDVTVYQTGADFEMMPYVALPFDRGTQDSFCGEARSIPAEIVDVELEGALQLTGQGPPLCSKGIRFEDGMCDDLWLFAMPKAGGGVDMVFGRN